MRFFQDEFLVGVTGIIFNDKTLSQFLVRNVVSNLPEGETASVYNLDSLNFSIPKKDQFSPVDNTLLSFVIQGSPRIVWNFDETALINDTLGKSKEEFKTVLSQYKSIQKAEVILRPFWKGVFPNDPKRVQIDIIIDVK